MNGNIEQGKKIDYRKLILLATGHLVADINNSALPAMLPFIKEALGLSFGMGGLGAVILGLFADLWGVPTTLWIIAFLPCGAFLMAALIPYQSNARTSIPTNSV